MIENKNYRAVRRNFFDSARFDAPKEKTQRDADKSVNKLARETAFAEKNHFPQTQDFDVFGQWQKFFQFFVHTLTFTILAPDNRQRNTAEN